MIYFACALVSAWSVASTPVVPNAPTRTRATTPKMADEHFDYLVIGGGSGGIASGRRAAAHGAKVAVNYVSNEDAAKEVLELMGGAGCIVQGDQSSPEDVSAMVATVTDTLGPIDLLVNNAGIAEDTPHSELTFEDWKRTIDVK